MPTIGTLDQAILVLGLFAPGFIILYFRSQLLTGRTPPLRDSALAYVILSVVYYALAYPLIGSFASRDPDSFAFVAMWFTLIIVLPAVFGSVLGLASRHDVLRRMLGRIGINPVHAVPTAWDWKFSRVEQCWVLVTLKNDIKYRGIFGERSFASSDPSERDLYIEQLYVGDDVNEWTPEPNGKGVYVNAGEIRTIEFYPTTKGNV